MRRTEGVRYLRCYQGAHVAEGESARTPRRALEALEVQIAASFAGRFPYCKQ